MYCMVHCFALLSIIIIVSLLLLTVRVLKEIVYKFHRLSHTHIDSQNESAADSFAMLNSPNQLISINDTIRECLPHEL